MATAVKAMLYAFPEEFPAAERWREGRDEHVMIRTAHRLDFDGDFEDCDKVYASVYCYGRIAIMYRERRGIPVEAVYFEGVGHAPAERRDTPWRPSLVGFPAPDVAVVVGGAACVWEDLTRLYAMCEPGMVVAVNDVGLDLARVDHWASLHPDRLYGWTEQRPGDYTTWTHWNKYDIADRRIDHPGGSSGAFGVAVALEAGASRVVLCGAPMDADQGHYFGAPFTEADRFRQEWTDKGLVERWQGTVTSMSGWTREQMGEPTTEWLKGIEHGHKAAAA